MNDQDIVKLYWARSEAAIDQTRAKYGAYCRSICRNILRDRRDVEECMADVYLAAWNSIPPQRPALLGAYLGGIARRLSLKKWRDGHASKRGGGETALALDELAECIPGGADVDSALREAELTHLLDGFLAGLDADMRRVFLRRYWYLDSIAAIARRFGFSQSKVKSMLLRARRRLQRKLEEEEFFHE